MDRHFRKRPRDAPPQKQKRSGPKRARQITLDCLKKVTVKKDILALKDALDRCYTSWIKNEIRFGSVTSEKNTDEPVPKASKKAAIEFSLAQQKTRDRRAKLEDDIRETLDALDKEFLSYEALRSTLIGKSVNKLTRPVPTQSSAFPLDIIEHADLLVSKWRNNASKATQRRKALVQADKEGRIPVVSLVKKQ